ncbi:MAG: peptidylprolyl isomerase [Prevotella sp.]|nr:peptidylprolyl isomerase [Prevotella sp.]
MRQLRFLSLCFLALLPLSILAQEERAEVLLETTEGNIRIALFNETPQHRDNFLKLNRMHIYDSLLFHRVIKDFMIQAGDFKSKNAKPGQRLGSGELDYTVEAEFRVPKLFHRRGVVAAAREPNRINPEQRSGALQFYIVWGRPCNDMMLDRVQVYLDSMTQGRVQLTPDMIATYKSVGGTPHLDGQYTVFGEVIEGLDVVGRIQEMETDKYDRPYKDVRILRATIVKDPFAPKEEPKKPKPPINKKRKRM